MTEQEAEAELERRAALLALSGHEAGRLALLRAALRDLYAGSSTDWAWRWQDAVTFVIEPVKNDLQPLGRKFAAGAQAGRILPTLWGRDAADWLQVLRAIEGAGR